MILTPNVRYPFVTKMGMAFVMFGCFDVLCQKDLKKWDKK